MHTHIFLFAYQGGVMSARTLRAGAPAFSAAAKGASGQQPTSSVAAAAASAAKSGYWAGSEWVPASTKLGVDWKSAKETVSGWLVWSSTRGARALVPCEVDALSATS
jgi:hypothetical protein